jgi:DNA-binding winged helix-turn-helix (wHTH) protein
VKRATFEGFTLDGAARRLLHEGTELHLEPKAFELLALLVERRPEAVSKAEIRDRLWPDTFVSESSLSGLVAQLRKALGDDRRRARVLRTVHGFGYAFVAGAVEDPPPGGRAAARLLWGDVVLPLRDGENILGRGELATVRVEALGVSRRHARVVVAAGRATIEDLGSKNGTYVEERRISGATELRDGDAIRLSRELLVLRFPGRDGNTPTVAGG